LPFNPLEQKETIMNTLLLKLYIKLQDLASREEGQDMVEYALVCALLGFGWVMGTKSVASALSTAFSGISTTLGSPSPGTAFPILRRTAPRTFNGESDCFPTAKALRSFAIQHTGLKSPNECLPSETAHQAP
jgi:pilus assembly protein Flp/PilA